MNLNMGSWKEFRLTDIFIVKGGFYNKKPEHSTEGRIPFLASTETNNGVTEHYSIEDIRAWDKVGNSDDTLDKKIYKGNCIAVTVNGSVCNAFYQSEDFTCSHDITALYPIDHELTPLQALFICTVIMKEKYRWSYGRKPHDVKKFGKSIIKLPANENETVDWMFMEQYIKSLNHKPITTKVTGEKKLELNVKEWKEFKVGDLFTQERGKESSPNQNNTGDIPIVNETDNNNGITRCVTPTKIFNGNAITISINAAENVFYQPNDFCASVNIAILKAPWLNLYNGLFIVSLLKSNNSKYSYGYKTSKDKINNTVLRLPICYEVSPDGTKTPKTDPTHKYSEEGYVPDFDYMETYIKSLQYSDRI